MRKGIIILSIIFVIIVAIGVTIFAVLTREDTKQLDTEQQYTRKDINLYLGIWEPALYQSGMHSLEDPDDLKAIGANIVGFAPPATFETDGEISKQYIEGVKQKTRSLVERYKEKGLAVLLAPEPIRANYYGEPGPVPEKIQRKFFSHYNEFIIEMARLAEEMQVEIFSPMNEPDFKLSLETASSWSQEILPKIKKVYHGKVLWKGALNEPHKKNYDQISFKGYDIIGSTIFPFRGISTYREDIRFSLESLQKWAKRDNVPEVFASEFGTYKPIPISKSDEPKSVEYMFEEAKGKVTGYFILDPVKGFGTQIKGSEMELVIKKKFKELAAEATKSY